MAKSRKNQSAAIRFGPALVASFACLAIAGAAVGYVWQKGEIYRLGKQIHEKESRLTQLSDDNQKLDRQLADLRSPVMLDQRARELNLGLAPVQPMQVVRLQEPLLTPSGNKNLTRQFAQRPADAMTQ
jgi:cell division protein FtsB